MRLLYDKWTPHEIFEVSRIEITEEVYFSNSEIYKIDIRDDNADDDVYYKIDNQKYAYFPDELTARFTFIDGHHISCYMVVGRSKEKFCSVIEGFNALLEKMAQNGYLKQSDFDFVECTWE